ncbi:MAG: CoA pyrophosphatase [Proteobacteria bacterium]|nr:CoA pyrophosphatase [Pseudomonadota bacterium]
MSSTGLLLDDALRVRIRENLERFDRRPHDDGSLTPAAVAAVILGDDAGRACFVITRRSSRLPDHPGQWALPGGRVDPGEVAEETALRELREEVGLSLPESSVLGTLDDYPTRSGFVITPVVVWADGEVELVPDPREVESAYRVPLDQLDRPDVPRIRRIPESDRPVISIPMLGTEINAPTAAVLFQLREVAIWGRSTRVAHYDQPVFAWK